MICSMNDQEQISGLLGPTRVGRPALDAERSPLALVQHVEPGVRHITVVWAGLLEPGPGPADLVH